MDVRKALNQIKPKSVSCVMTSPPYWSLRDYGKEVEAIWDAKEECEHNWNENIQSAKGGYSKDSIVGNNALIKREPIKSNFCSLCSAWKGQLGLEPTFDLYIKHLCDVFDEIKRVLRKDGTCWVNLGDSYYSISGGRFENDNIGSHYRNELKGLKTGNKLKYGKELEQKNLCNIPARFSIEMQNRGWILRNVIIWHKPNCMPSSVKDRFTVDFEYLFFFVKNKKYWFETQYDEIATISKKDKRLGKGRIEYEGKYVGQKQNAMVGWSKKPYTMQYNEGELHDRCSRMPPIGGIKHLDNGNPTYSGNTPKWNEFGRNKRAVWTITTQPYREAHFATFPEELVITPIKAGCPEFICNKCGKAREPIFELTEEYKKILEKIKGLPNGNLEEGYAYYKSKTESCVANYIKKGYSSCSCSVPFISGIVLDPFAGSGTTLKVARDLKRDAIGIEIKKKYCDLIYKRLYNGNHPLINDFQLIK